MFFKKKRSVSSWIKFLGKGEKTILFQSEKPPKFCSQEVILFSLKRVFGFHVPQLRPLFLPGKQFRVRPLLLTNFKEGGGGFPIGAICVNVMKRRFTISSCIALFLGPFGIAFSHWLEFSGYFSSWLRRR